MADHAELTRPIIGIENRTAQEVFDIMADRIRHALRDQPAGVKVRGLVWRWEPGDTGFRAQSYVAPSAVGPYAATEHGSGWRLTCDAHYVNGSAECYQTLDAAKAAAQADYERRVLSALEPVALSKQEVVLGAGDVAMLDQAWREASPVIASPVPAEPSAEGWRPIETAPTDGRYVLLFTRRQRVKVGTYRVDRDLEKGRWVYPVPVAWLAWFDSCCDDDAIRTSEGSIVGTRIDDATHWMPLPPPPHGEGA